MYRPLDRNSFHLYDRRTADYNTVKPVGTKFVASQIGTAVNSITVYSVVHRIQMNHDLFNHPVIRQSCSKLDLISGILHWNFTSMEIEIAFLIFILFECDIYFHQ